MNGVRPLYAMGYTTVPPAGRIETLYALDAETGHTLCGRPVAICWSAEDAAGTQIDCRTCLQQIRGESDR